MTFARRGLAILLASATALAACGGGDDPDGDDPGEATLFANGVAVTEDVLAAFEADAGGVEFEESTTLVEGAEAFSPASGSDLLWQVLVFTGADPPLDAEAARAAAFSSKQFDEAGEGVYIGDNGFAYAARGNVVIAGPAAGSPQDATLTRWRAVLDGLTGDAPVTAVAEAPDDANATDAPATDEPKPNAAGEGKGGTNGGGGKGGTNGGGGNEPSLGAPIPGLPQPVNTVGVGDCIASFDSINLYVGQVTVTPCKNRHRGEVIEIVKPRERRWPGSKAIRSSAEEPCASALVSFGAGAAEMTLALIHPDRDAWTKSARVLCVARTPKPERGDLQAQLAG